MFLEASDILVIFLEPLSEFLPLRINARLNKDFERYEYGLIPTKTTDTLPTLEGGSVSPPANGTLPARAYTTITFETTLENIPEDEDVWYLKEDDKEILFHVCLELDPRLIKMDLQVPRGVDQRRFSNKRVLVGVKEALGFSRGSLEFLSIPSLRQGIVLCNDTNLDFYVNAHFRYAEYLVEPITDVDLVSRIREERIGKWMPMRIVQRDDEIVRAFEKIYGSTGYPLKKEKFDLDKSSILEKIRGVWKR